MASSLPTPVFAALGIVPAVLSGVRRLPVRAVQLPVLAVSHALSGVEALRREYDDLAERGERLVARLTGEAVERADALEDQVEDLAARSPFAGAYDRVEEALEDTAEALRPPAAFAAAPEPAPADVAPLVGRVREVVGGTVGQAADTLAGTVDAAADAFGEVLERAADTVPDAAERAPEIAAAPPTGGAGPQDTTTPAAELPKGAPTPKAVEPDASRVDTAASRSVVDTVAQVVAEAGPPVGHDQLPLPDYDHMTLGSLRGRLRALTVEQLAQIRTYEKAHADRLPVVTMLDNRIAKLATDAAATPPGQVSPEQVSPEQVSPEQVSPEPVSPEQVSLEPAPAPAPEQLAAAAGPSGALSPATTNASPVPPSHGDPTPAQPRS